MEKKAIGHYKAFDFYMLRTPLLSIDDYFTLFEMEKEAIPDQQEQIFFEKIVSLWKRPEIREAITVSSPSLRNSILKVMHNPSVKECQKVLKGMFRYLVRMSTRSTPFGLCSGVNYGKFGENPSLAIGDRTRHQKRARADMEWLLALVNQLENSREVTRQLKVQTNASVLYHGSRVKLSYFTYCGQKSSFIDAQDKHPSIIRSATVEDALKWAQEGIHFIDLAHQLHAKYPQATLEMIEQFLSQLVEQEFLLTELRPPLMNTDPFSYVGERLAYMQGLDELKGKLDSIARQIAAYNQSPVGQGDELYLAICSEMKQLADTSSPLQVDMALNKRELVLPNKVKNKIEKAAYILQVLSSSQAFSHFKHLQAYRHRFLEKYGSNREVLLLELLDEEMGLGAPETYTNPKNQFSKMPMGSVSHDAATNSLLAKWYIDALRDGKIEVALTDEQLRHFQSDSSDPKAFADSVELICSVYADSIEDLENDKATYVLGAYKGSLGAGRIFGRFLDLLDRDFHSCWHHIQKAEQAFHPDKLLAEVVFLPQYGRHANLTLSQTMRHYEIPVGTSSEPHGKGKQISLADLVVGCTEKQFYIKSKSLGKEIIASTCHMLNLNMFPNAGRFLIEAALESKGNPFAFHWGAIADLPFVPRLRCDNIVLHPASWSLNPSYIAYDAKQSHGEWSKLFYEWRQRWKVPRYVYVALDQAGSFGTDHRMLFDLDHPYHVEEIKQYYINLKDYQLILLTEPGDHPSKNMVNSPNGRLASEFVFPLMKKDCPVMEDSSQKIAMRIKPMITNRDRLRLPGSEWLFLKLYGAVDRQDEFIRQHLRSFLHTEESHAWFDKAYFMRYADPEPHIRLRFHGNSERLTAEGMPVIYQWATALVDEGLLSRLSIDTYDPEIERYGGPNLIGHAEALFTADSSAVSGWLYQLRYGALTHIDREALGVVSVLKYMHRSGLSLEEQFSWMDQRVEYKQYLDEYREKRSFYMNAAYAGNSENGYPEIAEALKCIGEHIRHFFELVRLEPNIEVYNDVNGILASVIHLHLNRLFGINRELEMKTMTLARHVLKDLCYVNKAKSTVSV